MRGPPPRSRRRLRWREGLLERLPSRRFLRQRGPGLNDPPFCGISRNEPSCAAGAARISFRPDAKCGRKERGHRGVRPAARYLTPVRRLKGDLEAARASRRFVGAPAPSGGRSERDSLSMARLTGLRPLSGAPCGAVEIEQQRALRACDPGGRGSRTLRPPCRGRSYVFSEDAGWRLARSGRHP